MFKSYFFLGLGIGMVISGMIFSAFSDKKNTSEKPKTELITKIEEKEDIESQNFKKLLQEIENLKNSDTKKEPVEEKKSQEELTKLQENSNKSEETLTEENSSNKKLVLKDSKEIIENVIVEQTSNNEKKDNLSTTKTDIGSKVVSTKEEKKPASTDNSSKTLEEIKNITKKKKGSITIIENEKSNTLAARVAAEKYQIQFRSSKNLEDCKRIQTVLADVIDTETIFIGEYYRVFSKESFSEEIAFDVSDKIKKIYNLNTIVWYSDYIMILKKDINIKNLENLQKQTDKFIETTIKFVDDNYVLTTKKLLPKNLLQEVSEIINNKLELDIIIEQTL